MQYGVDNEYTQQNAGWEIEKGIKWSDK